MMSMTPAAFISLGKDFLKRNNLLESLLQSLSSGVQYLLDFQSHKRLLKFRSLLYMEQLQSIERNLQAGQVAPRGNKMDRFY